MGCSSSRAGQANLLINTGRKAANSTAHSPGVLFWEGLTPDERSAEGASQPGLQHAESRRALWQGAAATRCVVVGSHPERSAQFFLGSFLFKGLGENLSKRPGLGTPPPNTALQLTAWQGSGKPAAPRERHFIPCTPYQTGAYSGKPSRARSHLQLCASGGTWPGVQPWLLWVFGGSTMCFARFSSPGGRGLLGSPWRWPQGFSKPLLRHCNPPSPGGFG